MEQLILVLGAYTYSFQDKVTKQQVEGCKVQYALLQERTGRGKIGYEVVAGTLTLPDFPKIRGCGLYKAKFNLGSFNGKAELKLADLEMVREIDLAAGAATPK